MTHQIRIALFGCNASDQAWACNLPSEIDARHEGTISKETYDAILTAKEALAANPCWDSIAISSDMACTSLENALVESGLWRTGNEDFLVYRFGGLYLRILNKHDRAADIEFEVVRPDGGSVIPDIAIPAV
ncbi:hypothetical protein [Hyphomicrobium sp.]|uniref:hypothetical protein n=1 Tax=Hyphomicrobium sp. TaxID=82 RepID=UPI002E32135E|nr:hypothetical protein [Hyphomicrobium sp.]HEX2842164.1 hypothetical protein [Hyphomicrobium sp.]